MNQDKIEICKNVIRNNFCNGDCGLYDCRNLVGDEMKTIYDQDGLTIDICFGYSYFEVFGLTAEEFDALHDWYRQYEAWYRSEP